MKLDPETIDVRIEELERVVDGARHQTLNDEDHRKLRGVVETLGQMARMLADKDATLRELRQMLLKPATTEKTRAVLERAGILPQPNGKAGEPAAEKRKRRGRGRKPASAFVGARKVEVKHPTLQPGDPCPECGKGKVYPLTAHFGVGPIDLARLVPQRVEDSSDSPDAPAATSGGYRGPLEHIRGRSVACFAGTRSAVGSGIPDGYKRFGRDGAGRAGTWSGNTGSSAAAKPFPPRWVE